MGARGSSGLSGPVATSGLRGAASRMGSGIEEKGTEDDARGGEADISLPHMPKWKHEISQHGDTAQHG